MKNSAITTVSMIDHDSIALVAWWAKRSTSTFTRDVALRMV